MIPFLDLLGPDLSYWVTQFVLTVARLSFVIMLMPGIGERVIPAQVRVFAARFVGGDLRSWHHQLSEMPTQIAHRSGPVFASLLSLFLGIGLSIIIWVPPLPGR